MLGPRAPATRAEAFLTPRTFARGRIPQPAILVYDWRMGDDPDSLPTNIVYVLGSAGGARLTTYVGWTNDLTRRLAKHNAGTGARSTRGRAWVVLHTETFATRNEAMSREWHLKRDRAFRKQLLERFRNAIAQPS